jgi:hypothetical protein
MADDVNQRKVHEFLVERFNSQEPFSKDDMFAVTDWKSATQDTYWSKQFSAFVIRAGSGRWRVSEKFRHFIEWERFQKHVTQVRGGAEAYRRYRHDNVLIFEFFMPLTHEGPLRESLDALFYRDTVRRRLRSLGLSELHKHFPQSGDESEETYINRVSDWVSKRIGGYSISHVAGRFRPAELSTIDEATEVFKKGGRYLVDETTAVVRFIFPCGPPAEKRQLPIGDQETGEPSDPVVKEEADRIRWVFHALFVQSIVQVVSGEDEIWMVETGMRNCLHIWRVESDES